MSVVSLSDEVAANLLELSTVLRAKNFTQLSRLPFQGHLGHAVIEPQIMRRYRQDQPNVWEYSAFAPLYHWVAARRDPDALGVFKFFCLNETSSLQHLGKYLSKILIDRLLDTGIITQDQHGIHARIVATPVGKNIYFHDTKRIAATDKRDYVFLGRCSLRLALFATQFTHQRRAQRVLDLCTGSGIQGLNLAPVASEITCADINPRAIQYVAINKQVNGAAHAQGIVSDLFSAISGRFDIITANTPFLLLREGSEARDGYGGKYGMAVAEKIYRGLEDHLHDNGAALLAASSVLVGKKRRNLLMEQLQDIFGTKGYHVVLHPISDYYSPELHDVYKAHDVYKCILYLVEIARTSQPFRIHLNQENHLIRWANELKITAARLKGHITSGRN